MDIGIREVAMVAVAISATRGVLAFKNDIYEKYVMRRLNIMRHEQTLYMGPRLMAWFPSWRRIGSLAPAIRRLCGQA